MRENIAHKISEYAAALDKISRERRRDFHKYPETAWLEMRTSAIIAKILTELGYEVLTGRQVCLETARMGVPEPEKLEEHSKIILEQGVPKESLTEDMKEGFTGVIGILHCGEGPVVALRFDIDALGLIEEETENHRPYAEGFSSQNYGMMHACGHDAHGVIGLGTAEVLMKIKDQLCGTVKLIFQPGEEGARGARAIVAHGHLDDVDYFVGTHVAPTGGPDDGDVTPGTWGSLATSKYDAHFYGQAAHAGGFPENGKSAIVAAANAVLNLTAISRHSEGSSRVNVGIIHGGTGRNVVPDHAVIQFEVRGETTRINQFMDEEARRICLAAAQMAGCSCEMILQGGSESQHSDEDFLEWISDVVGAYLPHLRISSCKNAKNWGSEDISLMMNRVQEHGGKAVYMRSMTPMASAQHTTAFDFDEKVLVEGIETFSVIVWKLMNQKPQTNP
ncbi:MAG: M20 family metallo-hydrolase [Lachnospiraceae bacterium]|jgi:aminobenzoyl-glutamate utilization protein A|nr:M20 family metallo-hydrolase [Lachnospiraceae bacterium]